MGYPGKEGEGRKIPETTQKKDGTTSAYSAATTERHDDKEEVPHFSTGEQGRATHAPGSTTQGGSNHGQGSAALGASSYGQGAERSSGASYENEHQRFAETGTGADGTDKEEASLDQPDPQLQGGTETEKDEQEGAKSKDVGTGSDSAGVP